MSMGKTDHMKSEEIALGSLNSKFYEKNGEEYYKIWPIFGQQINFILDAPVSKIKVVKKTGQVLLLKLGMLTLKMSFKPYMPSVQKLHICPLYFGFIPMGIYFCEISEKDKNRLLHSFGNTSPE